MDASRLLLRSVTHRALDRANSAGWGRGKTITGVALATGIVVSILGIPNRTGAEAREQQQVVTFDEQPEGPVPYGSSIFEGDMVFTSYSHNSQIGDPLGFNPTGATFYFHGNGEYVEVRRKDGAPFDLNGFSFLTNGYTYARYVETSAGVRVYLDGLSMQTLNFAEIDGFAAVDWFRVVTPFNATEIDNIEVTSRGRPPIDRPPVDAGGSCSDADLLTKNAEKCARSYAKALQSCFENGVSTETCDTSDSALSCGSLSPGCDPAADIDSLVDAVYGSEPNDDKCLRVLFKNGTKFVARRYRRARTSKAEKLDADLASCVAKNASVAPGCFPAVSNSACASASNPAELAECVCGPRCRTLSPIELETGRMAAWGSELTHAEELGYTTVIEAQLCEGGPDGETLNAKLSKPSDPSDSVVLIYARRDGFSQLTRVEPDGSFTVFSEHGGLSVRADGSVEFVSPDGTLAPHASLRAPADCDEFECGPLLAAQISCSVIGLADNLRVGGTLQKVKSCGLCGVWLAITSPTFGLAGLVLPPCRECILSLLRSGLTWVQRNSLECTSCSDSRYECSESFPCAEPTGHCAWGQCIPDTAKNVGGDCSETLPSHQLPRCDGITLLQEGICDKSGYCRIRTTDCSLYGAICTGTAESALCSGCGDGTEQGALGEECDDGNDSNEDSCTNDCRNAFCGDSFKSNLEQCDRAVVDQSCETIGFAGGGKLTCEDNCVLNASRCSLCGGSILDPGENCDGAQDSVCPGECVASGTIGACSCNSCLAIDPVPGSGDCSTEFAFACESVDSQIPLSLTVELTRREPGCNYNSSICWGGGRAHFYLDFTGRPGDTYWLCGLGGCSRFLGTDNSALGSQYHIDMGSAEGADWNWVLDRVRERLAEPLWLLVDPSYPGDPSGRFETARCIASGTGF